MKNQLFRGTFRESLDDAKSRIWSTYAKLVDNAEYLRVIEHKAHGETEATKRYTERMTQASEARDLALKIAQDKQP